MVAEILKWLINRLEPGGNSSYPYTYNEAGSNDDLHTETERVAFIRTVTEVLIVKCGVKINPRKLYSCSFAAAKELLKVTILLINAPQNLNENNENTDDDDTNLESSIDFTESRVNDLRKARELSSELTNHGAILYDLLKKETTNKATRNSHASRTIELSTIERTLKSSISVLEGNVKAAKDKLEQIKSDKKNIENKVERKVSELERSRNRLEALKKVRPAYLDEFTKYEDELRQLFSQYIVRARCVDALKAQLNATSIRTPSPNNISVLRPMDTSISAILNDDMLDDSDEDDSLSKSIEKTNEPVKRIESRRVQHSRQREFESSRFASELRNRNSASDLELNSSLNSDESDGVLGDIGSTNCMI